jgi:hypothetical protein
MAAKSMLSAGLITWPAQVGGLRVQLLNYDLEKDRGHSGKLPQDLVSTIAMSCYILGNVLNEKKTEELPEKVTKPAHTDSRRTARAPRERRNQRTSVRS